MPEEVKEAEETQTEYGILAQMLNRSDLWNFTEEDGANEDVKEIIHAILKAEVKVRKMPIKLKEAEISPQVRVAELEVEKIQNQLEIDNAEHKTQIKLAEIESENIENKIKSDSATELKKASIEAEARIKAITAEAHIKYRWRTNLIWAVAIVTTIYIVISHWSTILVINHYPKEDLTSADRGLSPPSIKK